MRTALFASIILSAACTAGAHAGSLSGDVARQAQQNLPEFLDLLAIPNVADSPADIQRNAAFLEQAFAKRGFKVRRVDNPARRPAVYAELRSGNPQARTVLLYAHFDGQPVIPENWSQPDPFRPLVKRRDAQGKWQDVGRQALQANPLDPELRVFARSASDDKAPIMMMLTAVDLLRAQQKSPAIHVKVLLDPEEEMGSPSLAGMIENDRAAFAADAMVILDGPQHDSGRSTIVFGNRGITQATLTVFGPRAPLHSGHFGNYAPNPAMRLARLLASMKDDNGRVLVKGYYDGVNLTSAERASLTAVGDDEAALRKRIGVARAEKVGDTYQEALQYPSLNVRGMGSAGIGAKAANIVPSEAVAEIDIRTTPTTDGRKLFELIKRHVEQQGYRLVEGTPSDEDRATYDKLASFRLGSVQAASRTPMDAAVGKWAVAALKSPTAPNPASEPVQIRMMGGTVPTDVLVDALRLPFVLIPTVNGDNNQHAHDENVRIGHILTGTEIVYSLLTTP
ncbi:MAG TPA: M20/M25/M40 family metallo-hydrolase [Steroidobacteraceae bacterium]|nr:M20/M25/M40 family metallo-hydrolase [Steroidobacteraceae bacterium]